MTSHRRDDVIAEGTHGGDVTQQSNDVTAEGTHPGATGKGQVTSQEPGRVAVTSHTGARRGHATP